MAIDPRIALQLQVPDIAGAISTGMKQGGEMKQAKQLRDLLPQAAQGDQGAIDQLWAVDHNVAMKMDERQRALARELTGDLSNAVRWADTPEKWQYVQQHYGQKGVDLSPYRFEDRERGLMTLGKLGEYLKEPKDNAPANVREYEYARSQGYTGSFVDYQNQMGNPVVQRNDDGTLTVYPRSLLGGGQPAQGPRQVTSKAEYDALPPGTEYIAPDGSRRTKGGPTPQASGGFPGN